MTPMVNRNNFKLVKITTPNSWLCRTIHFQELVFPFYRL
eukprot:UN15277